MTDHNGSDPLNTAAEAIGSTLGTVVGTAQKVGAKSERAVSDLREAAARAQVRAAAVKHDAEMAGRSVVKTAKTTIAKAKKTIATVKKRAVVAKKSGAKMVKTAKKTVAKASKTFKKAAKRARR
jgi:hypothetical protein